MNKLGWVDTKGLCELLRYTRNAISALVSRPDFPRPYRFPVTATRGNQRWKISEILEWAEQYRGRDPG